jgi:hypothetical protein
VSSADPAKAFTDFWKAQSQAFTQAQEQAGKVFVDGMQAMAAGKFPTMPDLGGTPSKDTDDLARAGQAMTELWSAATALSGVLAKSLPAKSAGANATTVEATWQKLIDPRSWMAGAGEMDDVLGRMAEGPRLADLWEVERRYARVLQAWMNVRRHGLEHNAVVLAAWVQAGQQFTKALAARTDAAKTDPTLPELDSKAALTLWTEIANTQLIETQRSDPYLQTQAMMIRASTELRLAQQEMVEHFGKQYGFPTRTELDDVHRTLTELRREIRVLRRAQRTNPAKPPAPVVDHPAIPPATRRQTTQQRGTR